MRDSEHKTEGRRRILVNHVVRADGSRSCELKVYCSGRDTAVPLEVCRERNARRHRVVPEDALAAMALKLAPPRIEEGFARVTIVYR